jgi:predicted nucleic acid-binding protein
MRKALIMSAFVVGLLLLPGIREVSAQSATVVKVPFSFIVQGTVLAAGVHVVCELMAGAPTGEVQRLSRLCDALVVRDPDESFAPHGRLLAGLHRAGVAIDAMDLLIATAAVLDRSPRVTRNARHFSKVPGLVRIGY